MKPNRILKAAVWLWVAAVATASVLGPSLTQAKYVASATVEASARVAKWDPFDRITPEQLEEDTASGFSPVQVLLGPGSPSVLLDEDGDIPTLTIRNDSEVTAKYVLDVDVDYVKPSVEFPDEEAFLDAILDSLNVLNSEYDDGIVVPYLDSAVLEIAIPAVTFRGLHITAYAAQVD